MNWREEQHPRNGHGEFTHASIGAWVEKAAEQLRRQTGGSPGHHNPAGVAAGRGERPPGWQAAAARHHELWSTPDPVDKGGQGRERTDAEHDEAVALDDAFAEYRRQVGLRKNPNDHGMEHTFIDDGGRLHDEYGMRRPAASFNSRQPAARTLGYTRVGEHPTGAGTVDGGDTYWTPSTHPDAGGLWINPKDPGTRHEPNYRNDAGHGISGLRKDPSPSRRRKEAITGRRRGEDRMHAASVKAGEHGGDVEHYVYRGAPGGLMTERSGTFGYGARGEDSSEHAGVFVAAMKRAKKRARTEGSARRGQRRTPMTTRGTVVEDWMGAASARMAQGRG